MTDLYEILGLEPGCESSAVRQRYLQLVRQYPPDREPQRFAAIRDAYDRLGDSETWLKSLLFDTKQSDSIVAIMGDARRRLLDRPIPLKTLRSWADEP